MEIQLLAKKADRVGEGVIALPFFFIVLKLTSFSINNFICMVWGLIVVEERFPYE